MIGVMSVREEVVVVVVLWFEYSILDCLLFLVFSFFLSFLSFSCTGCYFLVCILVFYTRTSL